MKRILIAFFLSLASMAFARPDNPFTVHVQAENSLLEVQVDVPPAHHLYAAHFKVTQGGTPLSPRSAPAAEFIPDPTTGEQTAVYAASFTAVYPLAGTGAVTVSYMGCDDQTCFLPQSEVFDIGTAGVQPGEVQPAAAAAPAASWDEIVDQMDVKAVGVGYLGTDDFLAFLDQAEGAADEKSGFALFVSDPVAFVGQSGIFFALIFILLGGLALNLTPCVLPMIPINLAIIGAGAQAGSKRRGFALGAVYGLGIALVYGLLGLAVVLTGSRFGTIQSSPWFSLSIAVIFAVLALAMFDVFHIDFSSFQSTGAAPKKAGRFGLAFSMGAVAALLAGACVAPVVIAVLLLAANLYELHPAAGLSLPFLLGLGMALPWPFAGAGLSFLPKPGAWMVRVKYGMGALILLFALYYAQLGIRGFGSPKAPAHADGSHLVIDGATNIGFAKALADARADGIPVMIDFGASWCKNCEVMDATTFKNETVKERLAGYRFIRYNAENPSDPKTKAVLEKFSVQGLPTYVVLGEQTGEKR